MAKSDGSSLSDVREALLDAYRSSALSFTTLFLGFMVAVFTELTTFHDYGTPGLYTIPTYAITVALGLSALYRGIWWSGLSHEALTLPLQDTFKSETGIDSLVSMNVEFVKSMLNRKKPFGRTKNFILVSVLGANLSIIALGTVFGGVLLLKYSMSYGELIILIGLIVGIISVIVWKRDATSIRKLLGAES